MDMRAGPATPDEKVDPAGGQMLFGALVKGGLTYRDDGEGWDATDSPPGIGLDPRTVALVPTLLRDATQASDTEPPTASAELMTADSAARALTATTICHRHTGRRRGGRRALHRAHTTSDVDL
jgi:hypothetical protein